MEERFDETFVVESSYVGVTCLNTENPEAIKSFIQSEIDLAVEKREKEIVGEVMKSIEENIVISQRTHRVGSHSDDYGGESDYPCDCDEKEKQIEKEVLESLKIKISIITKK